MEKILIYGILFFALFVNSLFQFGLPEYFAVGTEVLIYMLIVFSLMKRMGRGIPIPHLWYSFFFMAIITAISININGSDIVRSLYSLRLLYRFYFFYLGFILLEIDDLTMKRIINFIGILLILQLPVVAIKFYYYGISELTIGAYSAEGGSLSAMLPIIIIFYLAAYYLLYQADAKYIFIAISYLLLSIIGKKRAVAFLYPIQFVAIFYYIYVKGKNVTFPRKIGIFFMTSSLIIIVTSLIIYFNDSLNPEGEVGGSIDFKYAIKYAVDYQTKIRNEKSVGRFSTTVIIFKELWNEGLDAFFFGFGPGSTTRSIFDSPEQIKNIQRFFDKLQIAYGLTPMSKIALEYGLLGVITFSLILLIYTRICLRLYKHENDPYWKAFAAGSVGFSFSMVFFFFAYHFPAFWGDTLPCLYFFAMAVVYTRLQRTVFRVQEVKF